MSSLGEEFGDVGLDGELLCCWWVFLAPTIECLGNPWEESFAPGDRCWVCATHQCDRLSDGRDSTNNCSSRNMLAPAVVSLSDAFGEPCEGTHSGRVVDPLYKRVQSQRPDIAGPICSMCLPILGSRCHLASIVPCICNAEITRIVTFELRRKTVQEACCGRGKVLLKSVSKSSSDLHSHSFTLPKDRDGMSVSAFSMPGIKQGGRTIVDTWPWPGGHSTWSSPTLFMVGY